MGLWKMTAVISSSGLEEEKGKLMIVEPVIFCSFFAVIEVN